MTHRIVLLAALAATAAAAPLAAKPPVLFTAADVDRIAPMVDHGCMIGPGAKTQTPDQKIANCTAAVNDLTALQARSKARAERAGLSFLLGSFDFARAGGYLGIDKVRSRRVCETAERSYARLAAIDPTLFDPALLQGFQDSRRSMSNSAAACRKDFGTPAGAPALQPQ